MSEYNIIQEHRNWKYKHRVLLHVIMGQLAVNMFETSDPDRHKANEYDKFAVDVVKSYLEGKDENQNAVNLMVADSSLEALLSAAHNQLDEMSIDTDIPSKIDGLLPKGYLVMTFPILLNEVPSLSEDIVDEMLADISWSNDNERFVSLKVMSWVWDVRNRTFKALTKILLQDDDNRKLYEDIKQRLGVIDDYDEFERIMDTIDFEKSQFKIITDTYSWPTDRRVLFHALCCNLVDMLVIDEPELDDSYSYVMQVNQLIDSYKKSKYGKGMDVVEDQLDASDIALTKCVLELSEAWSSFYLGNSGFSLQAQTYKAIRVAAGVVEHIENSDVRDMLEPLEYDNDLKRFLSHKVLDVASLIMHLLESEFDAALREELHTIDHKPLVKVYNRIFDGFKPEPDEPSSMVTFLNPTVPDYYPEDPFAYYKRKMREVFKTIEKNKDIVQDGDYWCLICNMREWLHKSTLLYDEDEAEMAVAIAFIMPVEFITGLSKGVMRDKWDADPRFRDIGCSLLDDAISLLLLYLESEEDDFARTVNRRFLRLQADMKKSGFQSIDFDRIFNYMHLRFQ